jgi:hypothetical protein
MSVWGERSNRERAMRHIQTERLGRVAVLRRFNQLLVTRNRFINRVLLGFQTESHSEQAIVATDAELSGSFSGDQFIGQDLGATNFGGPGQ